MNDISELYDKYFAFMIDQCDKRSKSKGFSMMYDVTDAGLSNVEMVSRSRSTTARRASRRVCSFGRDSCGGRLVVVGHNLWRAVHHQHSHCSADGVCVYVWPSC
jgi:hypothetical protein